MVTSRRPAWSAFGGPTGRERPGPLGCDEFLYGFEKCGTSGRIVGVAQTWVEPPRSSEPSPSACSRCCGPVSTGWTQSIEEFGARLDAKIDELATSLNARIDFFAHGPRCPGRCQARPVL